MFIKNFLIFISLVGFIFNIFYSPRAQAAVYQCIDSQGKIEFRDTPCQVININKGTTNGVNNANHPIIVQENFLPYIYQRTSPETLKAQEQHHNSQAKQQKQLRVQERKAKRAEKHLQKEAEKTARKIKRREMHCQKARENIRLIEQKLRLGCKLHRHNRLRLKLQHYETLERRYCSIK